MAKKIERPDWWDLHPADMTIEQMQVARDWFTERHAALAHRAERYDNARGFLNQALIERLGVPHDSATTPPPYPDLGDDDLSG